MAANERAKHLDKPGHYSLYVISGRVTRRGATGDKAVALRSNTLELDVVAADPAWQEQTLSAAGGDPEHGFDHKG